MRERLECRYFTIYTKLCDYVNRHGLQANVVSIVYDGTGYVLFYTTE